MAGVDESQYKFTGIKYYFNSYTQRGRFNWVVTTYGTIFVAWFLFSRRSKRIAAKAAKLPNLSG